MKMKLQGFFRQEQLQSKSGQMKGLSCAACGLYRFALNPKLEPYGEFRKRIMIIGEAPGEDEDRRGRPWQGRMGKALQNTYKKLGIDLFKDCVSLNAVNCRPTDKKGTNRPPNDNEISCCRQKVLSAIKQYSPKVIILQGGAAVSSLIGCKWRRDLGGISKWRGWVIPDMEYKAWICPTFHPSFIERQEEENEVGIIWEQDLKRAFNMAEKPLPIHRYENQVRIIYDENEILKSLKTIYRTKPLRIAFDIETTGLKPYNTELHKIVAISLCYKEDEAIAFPFPKDRRNFIYLKRILENENIGKIAANMKYEDTWLNILHNIEVNPWLFDTMQATHILDNRPGITSLKFQSYVRFGLVGYDNEIGSYLRSSDSNTPNRIMELVSNKIGFDKLLLYNGLDSLMTFKLAKLQMEELGMDGLA